MFDVVEQLKKDWTDKYVVVDAKAPELSRFAAATGIVKTVNMNGRCLVEFDQFNNIGWYDIDPAFLKVVPKPLPKPAEAKEKPAAKPAAAKPTAAAKPAAAVKPAPAAKPAAAGRPSTADILAMARAKKAGVAPPAAPVEEPAAEPVPPAAEPEPAAEAAAPAAAPAKNKSAGGPAPTTTAEKIAWCRVNDAKS